MAAFAWRWVTSDGQDNTFKVYHDNARQADFIALLSRDETFGPQERAKYQRLAAQIYKTIRDIRGLKDNANET